MGLDQDFYSVDKENIKGINKSTGCVVGTYRCLQSLDHIQYYRKFYDLNAYILDFMCSMYNIDDERYNCELIPIYNFLIDELEEVAKESLKQHPYDANEEYSEEQIVSYYWHCFLDSNCIGKMRQSLEEGKVILYRPSW